MVILLPSPKAWGCRQPYPRGLALRSGRRPGLPGRLTGAVPRRAGHVLSGALASLLAAGVVLAAGGEAGGSVVTNSVQLAQMSLEELLEVDVVSASRYGQSTTEAPSAVTVVSAEEIQSFGWRTLAEVMRSVRGFYVSDDRAYSYLGVRGFSRPSDYNNRILLMVDGHRINDNIYDSGLLGLELPLDLESVERIEVVRGPGSSLYGSSAFFAIINVVTKTGAQVGGAVPSVEIGSWDTYRGQFSYGRLLESGVDFLVSGSIYDSGGENITFEDPGSSGGTRVARGVDAARAYHTLLRLAYRDFTLTGFHGYREKHVPTGAYGTLFNDDRHLLVDERWGMDLRYKRELGEDWDLSARVYYDDYHYEGRYPYDDPAGDYLNIDESLGQWVGTDWTVTRKLGERHRLLGGVEYRYNLRQMQRNYDEHSTDVYVDDDRTSDVLGAFVAGEVGVLSNLTLNVGMRFDQLWTDQEAWSPRVALVYVPVEGTTFKALYGKAFRAPNVYEAYYAGEGQVANPDLEAETINTTEFVYEQDLPWGIELVSSVYHYRIDGLISPTLTATDEIQHVNLEDVRASGFEVGLERRWGRGGVVRISYAAQEAVDRATDELLSNSPQHLAQFSVNVPVYRDKITTGFEVQYVGSVTTENRQAVDDYVLLNLTLVTRRFLGGAEASVSAYNLLDERYANPGGSEHIPQVIPQPGRSFRFKLAYRF